MGRGFINSFGTMRRDGGKHPSPNSGISEAAMAGALGIRLGGISTYHGRPSYKPFLGEDKSEIKPSFIRDALDIGFMTSLLMLLTGVLLKWLL
ncbi:MAG: hypothetical protein A2Z72_03940 [Omnitrophica bacterium RBG_13_46_9]|nr:MAG: hypothetical protein A2Z72_03940 [Omnitrophica bacterium RBG_13_46_9]